MREYDPGSAPETAEWLAAAEDERLAAVFAYHRNARIVVANDRLHAAIHVVVENQVALGETIVVETLARLQHEGLTRHDAIHAVGTVLVNRLVAAMKTPTDKATLAASYLAELENLTAQEWLSPEP